MFLWLNFPAKFSKWALHVQITLNNICAMRVYGNLFIAVKLKQLSRDGWILQVRFLCQYSKWHMMAKDYSSKKLL